MKIAVLPFNAAPGARPALARQFANFACEVARNATGEEVNSVDYLAGYEENGVQRFAMANLSEELNEPPVVVQFFEQAPVDEIMDGLFSEAESGGGTLTARVFERGNETPVYQEEFSYLPGGVFGALRDFARLVAKRAGGALPAELDNDVDMFGTADSEAFVDFLVGFDAAKYIEKANGSVAEQFDPKPALDSLLRAVKVDPDWEGPYLALLNLCRLLAQYRIGRIEDIEATLKELTQANPEDSRAWFTLGELFTAAMNPGAAADAFERAHRYQPEEPAILTRLALAQAQAQMPVNAERNLRKAIEMEGPDKPSMDFLAQILTQTGRAHEVPELWREIVQQNPDAAEARAKYAMALFQAGKQDEAIDAFEEALGAVEDNVGIKRYYAPVLAQAGDLDRAMDLYEDCLDFAPADPQLLAEYAQVLIQGGRAFEAAKPLRDLLSMNLDPNSRANTMSMLIEAEQPKRVESVMAANEKLAQGDPEGAVADLKPLKNWLSDYWKMWALLAAAHNQLEQYEEAEDAARRLLEMFPAAEPGYGELANALAGQGKHEEAYNLLSQAQAVLPQSVAIAINRGLAAKRVGKTEEARTLARQLREFMGQQAPEVRKQYEPILTEMER